MQAAAPDFHIRPARRGRGKANRGGASVTPLRAQPSETTYASLSAGGTVLDVPAASPITSRHTPRGASSQATVTELAPRRKGPRHAAPKKARRSARAADKAAKAAKAAEAARLAELARYSGAPTAAMASQGRRSPRRPRHFSVRRGSAGSVVP